VAATVRTTNVATVAAANTATTRTDAGKPTALAARNTGRMVRSGDAATPKGTAREAAHLVVGRAWG